MAWSAAISYSTLLLLLLLPLCAADDRLVPGKPLTPGATIVSDGGSFAFGFFSPNNSTPDKLYLGIWYNNLPQITVLRQPLLVAFRPPLATPASTPASAAASFPFRPPHVTRLPWAIHSRSNGPEGLSPRGTSSPTGLAAALLNTGNLVVRSPNGTALWQSFDLPCDTFTRFMFDLR
ncbi:hypothetical protein EJB05_43872, partial [Eragrostis curvula]